MAPSQPVVSPPSATAALASAAVKKPAEKKYKCQFCSRAFSRSEHRSRHERSHTKERPFCCNKCRSTFVRRDLLLRHDRTVHAKDGGRPLESRKRSGPKTAQRDSSEEDVHQEDDRPSQIHPALEPPSDDLDIEAAALLMTDFQSKAMASHDADMLDPGNSLDGGDHLYSQNMALPQMPWMPGDSLQPALDPNFMPHMSGPSATLAPHDQTPFINPEIAQHRVDHLPQISGGSQPDLHHFHAAASLSGLGTPGGLSPFASMMGPVSPVDYRKSPGPSQGLTVTKAPQVTADDQCARILDNIRRCDGEVALLDTFRLPNRANINRNLLKYFDLFHHHLPFLHPASFNPTQVAAPLLLAVLSIGALYTFDQEQAFMLHIGSKVLVSQFLTRSENFSARKCPLWAMQATLLNMIFAAWSGDPKGLEWACSIKGLLSHMVSGNSFELKLRTAARERDGTPPTHAEWIEDEGCRRSYYAAYIFFGMLTLTYSHEPAIGFSELEALDLPSSESLWTLEAAEGSNDDDAAWRDCLAASHTITLREAYDRLIQGETARYSAFGTRVMINALFLHVWLHKRSPNALQDVVTEYKMRIALDQWQKSLELCEPETVVVNLCTPHHGHPLIFNAMAMYRNTRARLLVDLRAVQEALRYHEPYEVAAAMTHARDAVRRSHEMLHVIDECFDCIQIPAKTGVRWVARTSATSWSIEHPLCGLDLIVILSLWLWRLEHDDEPATEAEQHMYKRLRDLFDDDSAEYYGTKLSATVARIWGSMIDEVVVWGIAKLIGESFKLHAEALVGFEEAVPPGLGNGLPNGLPAVNGLPNGHPNGYPNGHHLALPPVRPRPLAPPANGHHQAHGESHGQSHGHGLLAAVNAAAAAAAAEPSHGHATPERESQHSQPHSQSQSHSQTLPLTLPPLAALAGASPGPAAARRDSGPAGPASPAGPAATATSSSATTAPADPLPHHAPASVRPLEMQAAY